MVRSLFSFQTFVIILLFQRCTFSPHNEYVNPIKPPEPITVNIVEVNNPSFADPFYIIEPTTFQFTVNAAKPVLGYEVTIDGNIVAEGSSGSISFFLFPHSLPSGTHLITLSIRIATQSGSIAEKLNGEYYFIEKSFRLINDPTPPPNIIATASYENGHLTIRWPETDKKNFYYVIKRTYFPYDQLPDSIIRNTNQNVFVDQGYVGGEIKYSIAVNGYGFEQQVLGTVFFNDNPVDFKIGSGTYPKTVMLNWTKSRINVANTNVKFYAGLESFVIPLTPSNEIVVDTLVLGEMRNYWIETYRTGYERQRYRRTEGIKSPPSIKPFITQAILPIQNKLLALTPNAIYRYSLPSLTLEDSLLATAADGEFTDFTINHDGSQAVLLTKNWSLYGFNPLSFNLPLTNHGLFMATISVTNGNDAMEKVELGNISDNGLVTMVLSKRGKTQIVFDIVNSVVLWSAPKFNYLNIVIPPVISRNGLYLANDYPAKLNADIYKWSGSTFDKVGIAATGRKYFRSAANELINGTLKENFYSLSDCDVIIYDLDTTPVQPDHPFTVVRSTRFNALIGEAYFREFGYDDYTELFYTRYMKDVYSTLRLYDVNSMNFKSSLKAFTYIPNSHEFANDFHFSNAGYIDQGK